MSDDIVTRLWAIALEGRSVTNWTKFSWDIRVAIDEIELLRLTVAAKDLQIRGLAWEIAALEAPNE